MFNPAIYSGRMADVGEDCTQLTKEWNMAKVKKLSKAKKLEKKQPLIGSSNHPH